MPIEPHEFSFDDENFLNSVLERLETWEDIATQLIIDYNNQSSSVNLFLNRKFLLMASKSYFDDILKFKVYTRSTSVETAKKAAFTFKWLSRYKPIQLCTDSEEVGIEILEINQLFALIAACGYFENFTSYDLLRKRGDIVEELFYNLTYRDVCGKTYTLIFRLISEIMDSEIR
ncbi:MAG: hypothetical protein MRZ79_12565 [Bacteroidia bacterium]|nr:hypothetical protein [Bacteroidia bacterium]